MIERDKFGGVFGGQTVNTSKKFFVERKSFGFGLRKGFELSGGEGFVLPDDNIERIMGFDNFEDFVEDGFGDGEEVEKDDNFGNGKKRLAVNKAVDLV